MGEEGRERPALELHEPVMMAEVLEHLEPGPGMVVVDGTTGTGGHALELARRIGRGGTLVCIDRDPEMLERARRRLDEGLQEGSPRLEYAACSYEKVGEVLARAGLDGADAILLDIGINSLHIEDAERGFSFMKDGPLDGRFNRKEGTGTTVGELVNTASERKLSEWFHRLGDERLARRLAARIVKQRNEKPFSTTLELARVAWDVYPPKERHGRIHPATRMFQALRIVANDELGHVERGVSASLEALRPGGRLAVISFHSGEDRLVKRLFRAAADPRPSPQDMYSATTTEGILFSQPTRSAIACSADEAARNTRARSAKMRVIERRREVSP
ncbi:MAG: 16S rRNA (cytosine(1402)-N(4))-methyltransferase RsmH [Candidatus Sumerlaeia bacterium]|nr:16S rRNA (cytosine(1402)-N(4))-methyltransferase RsmH [Candidatus Sumerlaeia bacterium]